MAQCNRDYTAGRHGRRRLYYYTRQVTASSVPLKKLSVSCAHNFSGVPRVFSLNTRFTNGRRASDEAVITVETQLSA